MNHCCKKQTYPGLAPGTRPVPLSALVRNSQKHGSDWWAANGTNQYKNHEKLTKWNLQAGPTRSENPTRSKTVDGRLVCGIPTSRLGALTWTHNDAGSAPRCSSYDSQPLASRSFFWSFIVDWSGIWHRLTSMCSGPIWVLWIRHTPWQTEIVWPSANDISYFAISINHKLCRAKNTDTV